MKRKKSRFESFFSLSHHRKRWGASGFATQDTNYSALKSRVIDAGPTAQTRGSEKSLEAHLDNLKREFSGQPEIIWHHAKLIVLIRRGYQPDQTYAQFRALWDAEGPFLCDTLNIRWLVSATDTFAEHDTDPQVRAVAMMASMLTNLVKMQESERHITNSETAQPDSARIEHLQTDLVPLFEGLSCFTVGTDDTLRNMYWRMEPFLNVAPAGPVLRTIWDRMQANDTVFARMRALHQRDRTGWWTD